MSMVKSLPSPRPAASMRRSLLSLGPQPGPSRTGRAATPGFRETGYTLIEEADDPAPKTASGSRCKKAGRRARKAPYPKQPSSPPSSSTSGKGEGLHGWEKEVYVTAALESYKPDHKAIAKEVNRLRAERGLAKREVKQLSDAWSATVKRQIQMVFRD